MQDHVMHHGCFLAWGTVQEKFCFGWASVSFDFFWHRNILCFSAVVYALKLLQVRNLRSGRIELCESYVGSKSPQHSFRTWGGAPPARSSTSTSQGSNKPKIPLHGAKINPIPNESLQPLHVVSRKVHSDWTSYPAIIHVQRLKCLCDNTTAVMRPQCQHSWTQRY